MPRVLKAVVWSLVLPGAGQFYNKQLVKALLIGVPSIICALAMMVQYFSGLAPIIEQMQDMLMSGMDTGTIASKLMGSFETALRPALVWLSISTLLYVVAFVDAGIVAWMQQRNQSIPPAAESNA